VLGRLPAGRNCRGQRMSGHRRMRRARRIRPIACLPSGIARRPLFGALAPTATNIAVCDASAFLDEDPVSEQAIKVGDAARSLSTKGRRGGVAGTFWVHALPLEAINTAYVIEIMVLPERIELSTSPLPRGCSTTELRQPPGPESGARRAWR
jgi:hypothetical protein